MILPLSIHLARDSLRAHRFRTFLTTLGVAVATLIIALVLILTAGLRESLKMQTANLGENVVVVRTTQNDATDLANLSPFRLPGASMLNGNDFEAVAKIPAVVAAPMTILNGEISTEVKASDSQKDSSDSPLNVQNDNSNDSRKNIAIAVTNENLPKILQLKLASGNWWAANESAKNWVVLGAKLAHGLLENQDAIGQKIMLKNREFIVVGVLKDVNGSLSVAGTDVDQAAFISRENGKEFGGNLAVGQILARVESAEVAKNDGGEVQGSSSVVKNGSGNLTKLTKEIRELLGNLRSDPAEITVKTVAEFGELSAGWLDVATKAALIFAGVVLLVGGVGIMNIMLVAVGERTHEIGIRKAVGATRRQLISQFLAEAMLMCLGGAILGLILAYGVAYLIALQFSLPMRFDWWIFAIGLGVPIAISLIFGVAPAMRAAKMNPMTALRQ